MLESFEKNVKNSELKIKTAIDSKSNPVILVYDCSSCSKKGFMSKETPVTLSDISRISAFFKKQPGYFFKTFVSKEKSSFTGGLKLKKTGGSCIFFGEDKKCSISPVRPLHCRFVPCPKRIKNPELMDSLYLSSGSLEEQFEHQTAIAATKEYVCLAGAGYNTDLYHKKLENIKDRMKIPDNYNLFLEAVKPFRHGEILKEIYK